MISGRINTFLSVCAWAISLSTLGCQTPKGADPSSVKLIGGSAVADKSDFPATVQLLCTAAKIDERHFLTAGHCVTATSGGLVVRRHPFFAGDTVKLVSSLDATPGSASSQDVTILSVAIHSSYLQHNFNGPGSLKNVHDVAIIEVQEATPDVEIAALLSNRVFPGAEVLQGGYGCESDQYSTVFTDDGTRRLKYGPNVVKETYDGAFFMARKNQFGEEVATCPGDSGGPVYLPGDHLLVVGINSFGAGNTGSYAARLDDSTPGAVLSWIKSNVPLVKTREAAVGIDSGDTGGGTDQTVQKDIPLKFVVGQGNCPGASTSAVIQKYGGDSGFAGACEFPGQVQLVVYVTSMDKAKVIWEKMQSSGDGIMKQNFPYFRYSM